MSTAPASKSQAAYLVAKEVLAAGVGSVARGPRVGYAEPVFVDRASGSQITDLDGMTYIDYVLALGPLIHGHQAASVRRRVAGALDRFGPMIGLNHPLEAEAAGLVADFVPGVELVRFSSTGTEAVMMAVRIARALTGRPLIVKFEGHFHGWSDVVHWNVKPAAEQIIDRNGEDELPGRIPIAQVPGVAASISDSVVVLPWNDPEAVDDAMDRFGPRIAAIITEPLMGNLGCVEPNPGFLRHLRDVTQRAGSLLIFDEVITGFRLARGGAQEFYGVTADLVTYAKAIGGGYPVSAVAGSRTAMAMVADESLPYLGTYNTSPLAMAAVLGSLEALGEAGVYERLYQLGDRLSSGLAAEFAAVDIPVVVSGMGPVFQLWFSESKPRDYQSALKLARPDFFRRFHEAMRRRGVLIHPSQYEHFFLSTAHSDADVEATLEAAHGAVRDVRGAYDA